MPSIEFFSWVFWCLLPVFIPSVSISSRCCPWCVWLYLTSQHTGTDALFTWQLPGFKRRKFDLLRCYPREICSKTTCPGVRHWSGFRPNILGKMFHVVKSPGVDPDFVGPEAYTSFGGLLKKKMQNYNYNIRYENEYLFRAPTRVLEEVHASKGPEA